MGKVDKVDYKKELKLANKAYTECLAADFLQRFLKGENVNVEDFCKTEYNLMMELDKRVYQPWKPREQNF